jgi:Uma2 family endonuclease
MMLQLGEPQLKRWTREEYYRLADDGWFDGQNVQLIEGEIIEMPPQKHPHSFAVSIAAKFLRLAFGEGYWVREEKPLHVARDSEPEPDVAVVVGDERDFTDHPTSAVMVVEVSESSLPLDRRKAKLYAAAKVEEYWIVNLNERRLEVFRRPIPQEGRYAETIVLSSSDAASPQTRPNVKLTVSDLFQ